MHDEIQIASNLGIGLVQIRGVQCTEVLSSPFYTPIEKLSLRLLETLRLGHCQLCSSFFETGSTASINNRFSKLAREDLQRAIRQEKGLMFWNRELGERKARLGVRESKDGTTYERRFICPDCVYYILSQFLPYDENDA